MTGKPDRNSGRPDRKVRRRLRRATLVFSLLLGAGVSVAVVLVLLERWEGASALEAALSALIGGAVFFLTYAVTWLILSLALRLLMRNGS